MKGNGLHTLVLEFAKEKAYTGSTPRFSSNQRDKLYSLACAHIEEERYGLAVGFLRFLVLLDSSNPLYWSTLERALLLSQEAPV